MTRPQAETFDRPWLLLCEGADDKTFFHKLIGHHRIFPGQFKISFPGSKRFGGGRGKFGSWLSTTYETSQSFRDNVQAVLVVSDNDDDPEASFAEIKAGLRNAGLEVPDKERTVIQGRDQPAIVVLMIPIDAPGNLETLCVRAAHSKWNLEAPLDQFLAATPAVTWRPAKQSKMQMHTILASTCEAKPGTSLAYHWQEEERFHIPIGDPAFNEIVQFLNEFEVLLAGAA